MAITTCEPPKREAYFENHEEVDAIYKGILYVRAANAKLLAQIGCGQEYDVKYEESTEGGVTALVSKFTRSSRPFAGKEGFLCKQLEGGEYIIFREGEK